ncbi:MAG: ATP-binding protein [Rhodoferax sp.]|nr:ATP-binding protein [Rhodoferax sp.]
MLIQFTVSNYRSFREPQTLSMVASKALRSKRKENTISPGTSEKGLPSLLRCAAVFGPNASGKSNLVKALQFTERMVMHSAGADDEEAIDVQPFRLNRETSQEDSSFEIEFIEEDVRYQFGFTANEDRITSEWLICYPRARPQQLYRRRFDEEAKRDEYDFGAQLEGGRLRKDWASQTGPKTLYISRVVQASSQEFQQLRIPAKWFTRRLRVSPLGSTVFNGSPTSKLCETPEGLAKVIEFLNSFDLPIVGIEIAKKPFDVEGISKLFSKDGMEQVFRGRLPDEIRELSFTIDQTTVPEVKFKASEESSGTLNLVGFAAKWIDVVEKDWILVVDELDSSLHPLVVWELIRKLTETESKAQLIFTTHDATVLRSKLLRRDQVFFVAPDKKRASHLYSLFDFKGREDDAFEDRYLQGRYGATPKLVR